MAKSLKVDLEAVQVRGADEFAGAFSAMAKRRVDGVVLIDDALLIANARHLADLAAKTGLPAIGFREYAHVGGLMAYAVNFLESWRRAAVFVDKPQGRETRGAALGLAIPQSVLVRADQAIE